MSNPPGILFDDDVDSCDCCRPAVLSGAAIAFGLMGMAEAIRLHGPRIVYAYCAVCGDLGMQQVRKGIRICRPCSADDRSADPFADRKSGRT